MYASLQSCWSLSYDQGLGSGDDLRREDQQKGAVRIVAQNFKLVMLSVVYTRPIFNHKSLLSIGNWSTAALQGYQRPKRHKGWARTDSTDFEKNRMETDLSFEVARARHYLCTIRISLTLAQTLTTTQSTIVFAAIIHVRLQP